MAIHSLEPAPGPLSHPLGTAAGRVYLAIYDVVREREELNAAQVAYELAKLVLAGPLAAKIKEQ